MKCKTIKGYKENGKPLIVNKQRHKTISEAEMAANMLNQKPKNFIRRVSYKCPKCGFYHVGTSYEMLNKKPPKRRKIGVSARLPKIVGKVDITSIQAREGERKERIQIKKIIEDKTKCILNKRIEFFAKNEVWGFHVKKKIVEITKPDGSIKKPSFLKVFGERMNDDNFTPLKGDVTSCIKINLINNKNYERTNKING